ncbi:probable membrane-associated kinase regulator 2 [Primulina eburnea]|uniref:probable membrane-associated kinase regulator 2 n=1 Tax=Primulina eburnea TaxID=1245227 RepID=UPI003C6BE925
MEAFSLFKYWRTSGGSGSNFITADTTVVYPRAATKTIFTSSRAEGPGSSDGEDGPYFDLEFALPEDERDNEEESSEKTDENYQRYPKTANGDETGSGNGGEEMSEAEEEEEEEGEVNITLTSDQNRELTLSPSEVLFKGSLVSVEPTSIILNDSEDNSRFPVFLLKSATKFRVLLLKLKKSKYVNRILEKTEKMDANGHENSSPREFQVKQSTMSGKFLTVMCQAEEARMPLVSSFTRDNSSKSKHGGKCTKNNQEDSDSTASSEERNLTKEVVQKYIKMLKPLYVGVSKHYVEKLKFSGQSNISAGAASKRGEAVSLPAKKEGETTKAPSSAGCVNIHSKRSSINSNLQAGLKVVRKGISNPAPKWRFYAILAQGFFPNGAALFCQNSAAPSPLRQIWRRGELCKLHQNRFMGWRWPKHLGKIRSTSAIVTPPPPPGKMDPSRRDDSLLQIHDGIQGAILHCKKSFNASRDVESSGLSRSVSDPSYEKSVIMSTDSSSSTSSSSFSWE